MNRLTVGHVGLHVRDLDEEIEFLEFLGCEVTARDRLAGTRVAFISMDGEKHHNFALFEDGEAIPSGDSRAENRALHHVALHTGSREEVDGWRKKLADRGIDIDGPRIHGSKDGGMKGGSGSYAIFFSDPNGICFEIYCGAMSLAEFRKSQADEKTVPA